MPKIFILVFLVIFCLFPATASLAFEAKGQDCSKCHTLSKDEARNLLKDFPTVKILEIRSSPIKCLWEVYLESRGQRGLIYLDFEKKHFFSGNLVSIAENKNLTKQSLSELNRADVSQISLQDALVIGDEKARIRVIVFSDPD